jgi:hypothetical protein
MNMADARKIWGSMMNDEELKEWLDLKNKIKPEEHDSNIPKGATIEIDPNTGKHVPRPF